MINSLLKIFRNQKSDVSASNINFEKLVEGENLNLKDILSNQTNQKSFTDNM